MKRFYHLHSPFDSIKHTLGFKPSHPSRRSLSDSQNTTTSGVRRPPISALLVDVSGNLHVGITPTPGALDAFRRLSSSSLPFRLCSNTSKESTGDLIRRLDELGFDISNILETVDHSNRRLVWTSIGAVGKQLKLLGATSPYFLLSESAQEEVLAEIHGGSDENNKAGDHDSVVVGLAPVAFEYSHLNAAFRILKGESGAANATITPPLIATHRAKFIQAPDGHLSLGPGPFVTALEEAAGVKACVVGKPEVAFYQMVVDDFGVLEPGKVAADGGPITPENVTNLGGDVKKRIAVIGDDIEADLGGGAIELGFWRVLVKNGKIQTG